MIKNYVKLFALALGFAFMATACTEDDETMQVSGKKFHTTYAKSVQSSTLLGTQTLEYKTKTELENRDLYWVLEFKSDGDFYVDSELGGSWTQTDDKVLVDDGYEPITLTVSDDNLIMTETYMETVDGIGFSTDVTVTNTITFSPL